MLTLSHPTNNVKVNIDSYNDMRPVNVNRRFAENYNEEVARNDIRSIANASNNLLDIINNISEIHNYPSFKYQNLEIVMNDEWLQCKNDEGQDVFYYKDAYVHSDEISVTLLSSNFFQIILLLFFCEIF